MSMIIPAGGIRRKKLIRQFLDPGAASPETAQTLHDIGAWKGVGLVFDKYRGKRHHSPLPGRRAGWICMMVHGTVSYGRLT